MSLLKKIIPLIFISVTFPSLADIYCPDTLMCYGGSCTPSPLVPPVFDILNYVETPIPDGVYYFSSASANSESSMHNECQYRSSDGHTYAWYQTAHLLIPNLSSGINNSWRGDGNIKEGLIDFICAPNPVAPYLADPKRCPFRGEDVPN